MFTHTIQNVHSNQRNSALRLGGSVGRHGDNNAADVISLQSRLNTLLGPPRKPLKLTGAADAETIGAIIDFQTNIVRMRRPDGRVDVGGRTLRMINDPNTAGIWKRSAVPHEAIPMFLAPQLMRDERLAPAEKLLAKEAAKTGEDETFEELRRELVDSMIPQVKKVLGTIGRAEDARTVVAAWSKLRKIGFSSQETGRIVVSIFKMRDPRRSLKIMDEIVKPTSAFGRVLERAGKVAGAAGKIVTLIEVADKFIDGDYLFGATELYKELMGKAIPWAALIDGLQSLWRRCCRHR